MVNFCKGMISKEMGCCTFEGKTYALFFFFFQTVFFNNYKTLHDPFELLTVNLNKFICTNQPNYNEHYTQKFEVGKISLFLFFLRILLLKRRAFLKYIYILFFFVRMKKPLLSLFIHS